MSVSGIGGATSGSWDPADFATSGVSSVTGAAGESAARTSTSGAPFDPAVQPTIKLGRGNDLEAVKRLQAALNVWRGQRGLDPILVDGGFGGGTKAALQDLQRASGITPDGICGPATWKAVAAAATRPAPGPRPAETFPAASAPGRTDAATRTIASAWSGVPGTTSVVRLDANGGRPAAIHLPPGFDPKKPARVVTMFHGHGWNVGSSLRTNGVLERVKALGAADPQTVFVFPQSAGTPFSYWMKPPESFKGLHQQALGEAARISGGASVTVTSRTVDAHSGAGLTLQNAIRSGEFKADKVNLLDASYSDWSQSVARWALSNQDAHRPKVESWYTRHMTQAANNAAILRMAPGVVTTHDVTATEGHNAVPGNHIGTR